MNNLESKRKAIAMRLRLAREEAGLSQGQVAKKMEMHRPTISEIEAGRRKVSVEELSILASIYGVSVEWLSCSDTNVPDIIRDKLELAARGLTALKESDLNRILDLLSALKSKGDKQ